MASKDQTFQPSSKTSEEKETRSLAQAEKNSSVSDQPLDPYRWVALCIIISGLFMVGLDGILVNVAIPSIQKDLGASFAAIQFIVAGYTSAYAVLLVTGGRLGDLFGRKRLFLLGIILFVITSALCALAINPLVLIVARLFQGASAALLFPQVLALIQVTFTGRERDRAFSIYGVTFGLAQASGLALGGLLLNLNLFGLTWRTLFLINVPIGLVAFFLGLFFVHEVKNVAAPKLDIGGTILILLGLTALFFPLVEGRELGWPAWTFVCLGIAIIILAGFVFFEHSITKHGKTPLINLALFRNRSLVVGLLIALTFMQTSSAFFLILTFFLQFGLGFSPLAAGLTSAPYSIGVLLASFAAISIRRYLGRYVLTCGVLTMGIGLLLFIGTTALTGSRPTGIQLVPAILITGFGFGLVLTPLMNILLSKVPNTYAGAASGMLGTMNQIALSLGVALIGIFYFGSLSLQANTGSTQAVPVLQKHLQLPANQTSEIVHAFQICVKDLAQSNEPGVQPANCNTLFSLSQQHGNATVDVVRGALQTVQADIYSKAFSISIGFIGSLLVITAVLVLFLPGKSDKKIPD